MLRFARVTPLIQIVYQDEHLVVIDKPTGLLTHPTDQATDPHSCMSLARAATGKWVYPVHRLDRPTSGTIVFAFSSAVARALQDAMQAGLFEKVYLAIVRGHAPDSGTIDKPLRSGLNADGPLQEAVTEFRTLARTEQPWAVRPHATARYSLVEAKPVTGRTHQIRRHLRSIDHPILGDSRLGDGAHNRAFGDHLGTRRLMLHATSLSFPHPVTGVRVAVSASPDADWRRAVAIFSEA